MATVRIIRSRISLARRPSQLVVGEITKILLRGDAFEETHRRGLDVATLTDLRPG